MGGYAPGVTPLYEDFDNPLGTWMGYATYDSAQAAQLGLQQHIDLRTFAGNAALVSENWVGGTVSPQAALNHFSGIVIECANGTTAATSQTASPISIAAIASGYISLTFPNFPGNTITAAASYLDISSDDTGQFSSSLTDSLAFSSSTTAINQGNTEIQLPLSLLSNANPAQIYAVRLRLTATGTCAVTCLAIRVMTNEWTYAPVDINTLEQRLQATVPPTGSLSQSFTFPSTTIAGVPSSQWPPLMFSDGALGPQTLNTSVGVEVHTGSNAGVNRCNLYLREFPMTSYSMADLDQMTMGEIEALGAMPDGQPGTINDLAVTQYLMASFTWGTVNSIEIGDQTGMAYTFTPVFNADSDYYFEVTLDGSSLRVRILPIDSIGYINWAEPVFDSTAIIDATFVVPRNGRLGYFIDLQDGDTWISDVRPRRVVFSEFETVSLSSVTPVEGARLYPDDSPVTNLYTGVTAATTGVTLSPDNTKSNSGQCIRVQCNGNTPDQGIETSLMRFTNFGQTEISFDILLSSTVDLQLNLVSSRGRSISLPLPPISLNRWTSVTVDLAPLYDTYLPGPYHAVLTQVGSIQSVWYIDNFAVPVRSVAWLGRGQTADPWGKTVSPWIDFKDTTNSPYNGSLLGRGKTLQVKGQVVAATGFINGVQIVPKYAELGNFSWSDEQPGSLGLPTAIFSMQTNGNTVTVDGTTSTAPNGILQYLWDWGDGTFSYGGHATHTYTISSVANYTVTLTVIDHYRLTNSQAQSTTISNALNQLNLTANLLFQSDGAHRLERQQSGGLTFSGAFVGARQEGMSASFGSAGTLTTVHLISVREALPAASETFTGSLTTLHIVG